MNCELLRLLEELAAVLLSQIQITNFLNMK
jgi:hypothetical protein